MSTAGAAKQRLMSEYKALEKEKWCNIELNNSGLFMWNIALMVVNPESPFNGGYFKCEMTFTDSYPHMPPTFKFNRKIYHPNIYEDGKICISILHTPGEDETSGELASERWSSIQGVESVLRSVLLLLDSPEIGSPANVDAGIMYRDKRADYDAMAKQAVETSKQDIPEGFVLPTTLNEAPPTKMQDDDDFWAESEDDNFGASDTDENEDMEDEDMEDEEENEEDEDTSN